MAESSRPEEKCTEDAAAVPANGTLLAEQDLENDSSDLGSSDSDKPPPMPPRLALRKQTTIVKADDTDDSPHIRGLDYMRLHSSLSPENSNASTSSTIVHHQSDSDSDEPAPPLSAAETAFARRLAVLAGGDRALGRRALANAYRCLRGHRISGGQYRAMSDMLHNTVLAPGGMEWGERPSRIYEVAEAFVTADGFDAQVARAHSFNRRLVRALLRAIRSDHEEERSAVQMLVYHLYCQSKALRPSVEQAAWQLIQSMCHPDPLLGEVRPALQGLTELLIVVETWVKGFASPPGPTARPRRSSSGPDPAIAAIAAKGAGNDLRTSTALQKQLLFRVLMPLHKLPHDDCQDYCLALNLYIETEHEHWVVTLQNMIEVYLDADPSLAPAVLRYLLKHWPRQAMRKEVLFLTKVLRVLRRVCAKATPLFMRPMLDPCLRAVARCLTSPNHLVANRALAFFGIGATFCNQVLDPVEDRGGRKRFRSQECDCVVVADNALVPLSAVPRDMAKLTTSRRRNSVDQRMRPTSPYIMRSVCAGQAFHKSWVMRARGPAWPPGCHLVHTSGAFLGTMGEPLAVLGEACRRDTELGLTVALVAPSEPGRFVAKWRMALPDGRWFGAEVALRVDVQPGALTPEGREISARVADHWRSDRPQVLKRSLLSSSRHRDASHVTVIDDPVLEGIRKRHRVLVNRIFFPALCLGERSFHAAHPLRSFDRSVWSVGMQKAFAEAKLLLHRLLHHRDAKKLEVNIKKKTSGPGKRPHVLRSLSLVDKGALASTVETVEPLGRKAPRGSVGFVAKFRTRGPTDNLHLSEQLLTVTEPSPLRKTQSAVKVRKQPTRIRRSSTQMMFKAKAPRKLDVLFSCEMEERITPRAMAPRRSSFSKKWQHRALALTAQSLIAFPLKDRLDAASEARRPKPTPAWCLPFLDLRRVYVSAYNNADLALVFTEAVHEVRGVDVSELLLFLKSIFRESCFTLRGNFWTGLRVVTVEDLSSCVFE